MRRALSGLENKGKEIKYIGLFWGQNKYEVSNQEGENMKKIKIQQ